MVRFFITLAWILLALLLVDSAMNDPDVKPVVERQFQRAESTVLTVLGWFQSEDASSSSSAIPGNIFVPPGQDWPLDTPASSWYWSTMLVTAVGILRVTTFTQAITRGVRPVIAPVSCNQGVHLARLRA